ncbi:uncharacterized protein LOC132552490, partial [Ylistrum balloti]|uniref:uncharacterized protein LOC132552490 n=1 Tax=Ylistrum balloti TaxID=509963 RepID=UPI002905D4EE
NDSKDAKEKFQEISYAYKYLTEGPSSIGGDYSGTEGEGIPFDILVRLFPWLVQDMGVSSPFMFGGPFGSSGIFGGNPFGFQRTSFFMGFDDGLSFLIDDDSDDFFGIPSGFSQRSHIRPNCNHRHSATRQNRNNSRNFSSGFYSHSGQNLSSAQAYGGTNPTKASNRKCTSARINEEVYETQLPPKTGEPENSKKKKKKKKKKSANQKEEPSVETDSAMETPLIYQSEPPEKESVDVKETQASPSPLVEPKQEVPQRLNKKARRKLLREQQRKEKSNTFTSDPIINNLVNKEQQRPLVEDLGDTDGNEDVISEESDSDEDNKDDTESLASVYNNDPDIIIEDTQNLFERKSRRMRKNEKKKQRSEEDGDQSRRNAQNENYNDLLPKSAQEEEEMIRLAMEMSKLESRDEAKNTNKHQSTETKPGRGKHGVPVINSVTSDRNLNLSEDCANEKLATRETTLVPNDKNEDRNHSQKDITGPGDVSGLQSRDKRCPESKSGGWYDSIGSMPLQSSSDTDFTKTYYKEISPPAGERLFSLGLDNQNKQQPSQYSSIDSDSGSGQGASEFFDNSQFFRSTETPNTWKEAPPKSTNSQFYEKTPWEPVVKNQSMDKCVSPTPSQMAQGNKHNSYQNTYGFDMGEVSKSAYPPRDRHGSDYPTGVYREPENKPHSDPFTINLPTKPSPIQPPIIDSKHQEQRKSAEHPFLFQARSGETIPDPYGTNRVTKSFHTGPSVQEQKGQSTSNFMFHPETKNDQEQFSFYRDPKVSPRTTKGFVETPLDFYGSSLYATKSAKELNSEMDAMSFYRDKIFQKDSSGIFSQDQPRPSVYGSEFIPNKNIRNQNNANTTSNNADQRKMFESSLGNPNGYLGNMTPSGGLFGAPQRVLPINTEQSRLFAGAYGSNTNIQQHTPFNTSTSQIYGRPQVNPHSVPTAPPQSDLYNGHGHVTGGLPSDTGKLYGSQIRSQGNPVGRPNPIQGHMYGSMYSKNINGRTPGVTSNQNNDPPAAQHQPYSDQYGYHINNAKQIPTNQGHHPNKKGSNVKSTRHVDDMDDIDDVNLNLSGRSEFRGQSQTGMNSDLSGVLGGRSLYIPAGIQVDMYKGAYQEK